MPKYRKNLIVIEAVKWDGNNLDEILEFVGEPAYVVGSELFIKTLEGGSSSKCRRFIIKGRCGRFYPCKPFTRLTTFNAGYKRALEAEACPGWWKLLYFKNE